jgi:hypothetical protein
LYFLPEPQGQIRPTLATVRRGTSRGPGSRTVSIFYFFRRDSRTQSYLEKDPSSPVFTPRHEVRYDFDVIGTEVKVTRNGKVTDLTFSTKDKDRVQASSPLHDFLETIGRSRVDAHMVCEAVERGQSIHAVMGNK